GRGNGGSRPPAPKGSSLRSNLLTLPQGIPLRNPSRLRLSGIGGGVGLDTCLVVVLRCCVLRRDRRGVSGCGMHAGASEIVDGGEGDVVGGVGGETATSRSRAAIEPLEGAEH